MNGTPSPTGWRQKVLSALVLLLLIAVGAHVIWSFLAPLIPALVALVVLLALGMFLFGTFRRR